MQPTKNNVSVSVSFTGYRTRKILQSIKSPDLIGQIYLEVYNAIKNLHEKGYTTFLSGMSEGFDMIAAEAVLALRSEHINVKLIAVIPFEGQELGYADTDKARYKAIFDSADEVVFTSYAYHERCYLNRNDYLLTNCSMVVCYYSGLRGGTMYTVNRARRAGLPIVNILNIIMDKKDA